jgi:UDP-N-acetylmuramate dehydrogenase
MKKHLNLKNELHTNHPLAKYTSWQIGGPAEYFYRPESIKDLINLLQNWQDEPITILGAGSNVLIRDKGIKGLVIYLRGGLNQIQELDENTFRVESGVSLRTLVQNCANAGMLDAAFMAGIPGTLGGALKMNAGAYGGYIWNHVKAVETINRQGQIKLRDKAEFAIGYREVKGLSPNEWFVAAHLHFVRDDVEKTKQQIETHLEKRTKSQPLEYPSCGSVFRNPTGDYASRLIEANKLKGRQIGGAKVSEKHANFIINCGNATAMDVEALIEEIILAIEKAHQIKLIPEVHILGEI